MSQSIAHLTLLVRDYDEALEFFTQKLDFHLLQDTPLPDNKRWLLVAPPSSRGAALLLAEADSPEQSLAIGNQTGGRVFLFLHTDDFWHDYKTYQPRGVRFLESPARNPTAPSPSSKTSMATSGISSNPLPQPNNPPLAIDTPLPAA